MPTNAAATGFWSAMPGGSRVNNARQGRALLQAVYQNNDATPMNGTRSGVLPTTWDVANTRFTDLLVTVTSGLTMGVAPGSAIAHRSGQGPYEGWLTAAASVTCDPAPASNPRNDIVVMRWYDSTQGDTSPDGNPCRIEIITGTPGAVPADPISVNSLGVYTSFPTSGGGVGIPLARAQVSTGGVITLTRLRRSVGVLGATRALLEGDSDTAGSVGDHRYNPATDVLEVKDSAGNWQRIVPGATGYAEYSQTAAQTVATSTNARMTFDTAVESSPYISYSGGVFTVNRAGTWSITGTIRWNGASGNGFFERAAVLSTTSATAYRFGGNNDYTGIGGGQPALQLQFAGQKRFAAGDTFAVWLWQASGGNLTTNVALDSNRIQMKWTGL
ncbi:hypothetical protein [Amycolatopsis sp. NBC_00438]|uniref:hypothetical protein n=1 Tax=Amycolatopsis sp. NBC_00438 TaxID=2903558 RepID=UPI002E1CF1D3